MTRMLKLAVAALFCAAAHGQEWKALFDGNGLGQWRPTGFQGQGEVSVSGGALTLGAGGPLTGVNWGGEFAKTDYEIRYEAMRVKGGDFFASLTFPVAGSHMTLVTGGWGGDIVGVSSIDGWDASENETRTYFTFEPGKWYAIRLRVTDDRIQAWIDGQRVVNVEIRGRTVGMRPGPIELSKPLGFASYRTEGRLRKVEWRSIAQAQGRAE